MSEDAISSATGLTQVLSRLDYLYLKDETLQKYDTFEAFDSFRRPSHMSIPEFLHAFNLLSNKLQSYGTTISDDLLAFKLLKAANLSPDHEKLAKATCDLKYSSMKDQLHKIFVDTQSLNASAPSATLRPDHINLADSSSATVLYIHVNLLPTERVFLLGPTPIPLVNAPSRLHHFEK